MVNHDVQTPQIVLGRRHQQRLLDVVERHSRDGDGSAAERLSALLRAAAVVPQRLLPPEIVAIGSTVSCRDEDTGERWEVVVSCPEDADPSSARVSILEPLAMAILGAAVGDSVEWVSDDGRARRVRIERAARVGSERGEERPVARVAG
jgi:regulator of nucleoside diphosphate kinase